MTKLIHLFVAMLSCSLITTIVSAQESSGKNNAGKESVKKQFIEVRTYTLKDEGAEKEFDAYAAEALIPALNRLGISPVGAFSFAATQPPQGSSTAPLPAASAEGVPPKVMLLIAADSLELLSGANARVEADPTYQQAAAKYLNTPADKPLLSRISSELLVAFDVWPKVAVPKQKGTNQPRLFELRTYESPSEHLGHLKVEMFNSGEVPIFLACDIQPVFMGQAVVGSMLPNLTYMTVYNNAEERNAAWKRFADNADWKVLREVEKYKGTVSKIHKTDWLPKPYSQL